MTVFRKLNICVLIAGVTILSFGCSKKEPSYNFGAVDAQGSGTIDFSEDEVSMELSDIKAEVGEDIDYMAGVNILNDDKVNDLKMWVDTSAVDIDTPGTYDVKYTVNYGGKAHETVVKVQVNEAKGEASASESANGNNQNNNSNNADSNSNNGSSSNGNSGSSAQNSTPKATSGSNQLPTQNTTQKATSGSNQSSTQSTTQKATSGNNQSTQKDTTSKQLVTTANKATTSVKRFNTARIELLSGNKVNISCSSSQYIVSTRTDESVIEKNGSRYKVSKLIITFNTGKERVLETVEEKVG